jgi:hypothetical protein
MKKDINLRDKQLKRYKARRPVISVLMVSVVVIMFLIFFSMNSLLNKQRLAVEREVQSIEKSLTTDEFKEAYSFGVDLMRLEKVTNGINFLERTNEIIEISEKTIPQISFLDLKIEKDGNSSIFNVQLNSPDYLVLSNQIKLYKEIENTSDFYVEEVKRDENTSALSSVLRFDINNSK